MHRRLQDQRLNFDFFTITFYSSLRDSLSKVLQGFYYYALFQWFTTKGDY